MSVLAVREQVDFMFKIAKLTSLGQLAWESTADGNLLIAPLSTEYTVRIKKVGDLDGKFDAEDDHEVSLLKGRKTLFSLTRLDFVDASAFRTLRSEEHTSE